MATAYHEAGHAVIALSLGRTIEKLSVVRNSMRLGAIHLAKGRSGRRQDYFENEALILLGGLVAEARYSGAYNWAGAQQDLSALRRLSMARVENDRQMERLERRLLDKTEHLLAQEGNWESVVSIAEALCTHQILSGRSARHLFEEAIRRAT
jgi:ATP-dependent Zn protease